MAEIFVQHTLNSRKTAKFTLNLREYALKGEEGDTKWVLEIGTTASGVNGQAVPPKFIHKLSEERIGQEIEKAVASICTTIDWSTLIVDRYPPILNSFSPEGEDVYINSPVVFNVIDDSPSSGLDLANMVVTLNNGEVDFDITSEATIKGDPYEYQITWLPPNINR